jgi:hypothetical protein
MRISGKSCDGLTTKQIIGLLNKPDLVHQSLQAPQVHPDFTKSFPQKAALCLTQGDSLVYNHLQSRATENINAQQITSLVDEAIASDPNHKILQIYAASTAAFATYLAKDYAQVHKHCDNVIKTISSMGLDSSMLMQHPKVLNNLNLNASAHLAAGTLPAFKAEQEGVLAGCQVSRQANQGYDQVSEIIARSHLAAIATIEKQTAVVLEHHKNIYDLVQAPVHHGDVAIVEQREVGFSDSIPMGTKNVRDCVTVIMRDDVTGKAALAHVDYSTATDSITHDIIEKFPKDHKLTVHLVGAKDNVVPERSMHNMDSIITALKNNDKVTIASTAVLGSNDEISSIVYDPKSDKIIRGLPQDSNNDSHLAAAKATFLIHNSLALAFDLSNGNTQREPMKFTTAQFASIYTASDDAICQSLQATYPNPVLLANVANPIIAVRDANALETKRLAAEISAGLQQKGVEVEPALQNVLERQLLSTDKVIGSYAVQNNQQLIYDFVKDEPLIAQLKASAQTPQAPSAESADVAMPTPAINPSTYAPNPKGHSKVHDLLSGVKSPTSDQKAPPEAPSKESADVARSSSATTPPTYALPPKDHSKMHDVLGDAKAPTSDQKAPPENSTQGKMRKILGGVTMPPGAITPAEEATTVSTPTATASSQKAPSLGRT